MKIHERANEPQAQQPPRNPEYGAVVQSGEHPACTGEAVGAKPTSSTRFRTEYATAARITEYLCFFRSTVGSRFCNAKTPGQHQAGSSKPLSPNSYGSRLLSEKMLVRIQSEAKFRAVAKSGSKQSPLKREILSSNLSCPISYRVIIQRTECPSSKGNVGGLNPSRPTILNSFKNRTGSLHLPEGGVVPSLSKYALLAQWTEHRATDAGVGSSTLSQGIYCILAQLVARLPVKEKVLGSCPRGAAKYVLYKILSIVQRHRTGDCDSPDKGSIPFRQTNGE